MSASVDVVIVAYSSESVLRDCVQPLIAEPAVSSVTVVDHGEGGSAAVAEAIGMPLNVVVDRSNPGFGAGQNRGAAFGNAAAILMLNPDAVMLPGALIAGLELLDSDASVAAVQGVIRDATTSEPERSQGRELGLVHLIARATEVRTLLRFGILRRVGRLSAITRDSVDREPASTAEVDTLAATALLVRRAAFESIGGFDSSYFLYGEDLDLCRRLRTAGWKLVTLPTAWALHRSGSSSSSFVAREIEWWTGTLTFAAKWWSPMRFWAAMACAVAMAGRLLAVCSRSGADILRMVRAPVRVRREIRRSPASAPAPPSPNP